MNATPPEIKVGQHWQEVGERRVVEIVHLHNLSTVRPVVIKTLPDGRQTYASVGRFNGKRGGYKLVKDVA